MAKQVATIPITQTDLEEYLLKDDDFAFEIEVLKICQQQTSYVHHGGTYQDPVSGDNRQFDIRTWLTKGDKTLCLAVECKNLKTHFPLLVSEMPRLEKEAFHTSIQSGQDAFQIFAHTESSSIYAQRDAVGKSTVQIGRPLVAAKGAASFITGDFEVYEKWAQAIASAADLVKNASIHRGEARHSIILPILVVPDDTLWTVSYDASGQRTTPPKHSEKTTLFLGKYYEVKDRHGPASYCISHLNIFTKNGFATFLNQAKSQMADWFWH